MARNYSQRSIMLLCLFSGGFCANPECRSFLAAAATPLDPAALLTNIAHIEGSSDSGPRPNPALTDKQRDDYDNLILLCGIHHPLVDKQDSTYTVESVRDWKRDVEKWVTENRKDQMSLVTFAELQVVCDGIIGSEWIASTPAIAVPPRDKMTANDLGPASEHLLTDGLSREPLVMDFLQRMATNVDHRFPNRLRDGFVSEYERLRDDEGQIGDDLFAGMFDFARRSLGKTATSSGDRFLMDSASLAVLSHLFHICEVFEAPDAST